MRSLLLLAPLIIISLLTNGILPARASNYQPHPPILINGNSGFTQENGVIGGIGTVSDPYVIEGWEIASPPSYGISVTNTQAYFVIRNVFVHDSPAFSDFGAVDFSEVANGSLENATISENSGYAGIQTRYSTDITISGNTFESNKGDAILVYSSRNVKLANNLVRLSSLVGISIGYGGKYVEVVGNDVSSNGAGISVVYASVVVSGNFVHDNGFGYPYDGYGIVAGRRCDCTIVGNTVSNNPFGIAVYSGFSPFHNNLINNTIQAFAGCPYSDCLWTWDRGYPNGGNFWSDYAGVDNCNGSSQKVCPRPDGIGDTPYITDFNHGYVRNSTDRFPLMKPFAPAVSGTVSFGPTTIASQSNLRYLTASVGLPKGYNASNLILSSIRLNGAIALAGGAALSQSNEGGVLVVRFNMTEVRTLLSIPGNYILQLSGNLLTSTNFRPFEATATIRLLPQ